MKESSDLTNSVGENPPNEINAREEKNNSAGDYESEEFYCKYHTAGVN